MEAGDRYIYAHTHTHMLYVYIYIYRAKGYSRLGAALHGKGEWKSAIDAYKMGLELDPENALLKVPIFRTAILAIIYKYA
jgi:tetratricopeptide (TPR) repeat protein